MTATAQQKTWEQMQAEWDRNHQWMKTEYYENKGVVDNRTLRILFPLTGWDDDEPMLPFFPKIRTRGPWLQGGSELGYAIWKHVTEPLTDVNEINRRLDIIQELKEDKALRERIQDIRWPREVPLSSAYRSFEKYGVFEYRSDTEERKRDDAYKYIVTLGEFADAIPQDFEKPEFATKGMKAFEAEYREMIGVGKKEGILGFLKEMKRLKAQIETAEREKDGEKISYAALGELLQQTKLGRFKAVVESNDRYRIHLQMQTYIALADMAEQHNLVRPVIVPKEENCLVIRQGISYTPTKVDYKDAYVAGVPNPTDLADGRRVEIIEGANAAGKTVDLMKSLRIAVMALSGCFVPAEYAKVSVRDKIILRWKGDGYGNSAFRQDCEAVSDLFPAKGEYWLMGADELFTSTETDGGISLAYGLVKAIVERDKSLLLMSGHHHGLEDLLADDGRVSFTHFPYEDRGEEVVFPYTKHTGPVKDKVYAIRLAEQLGFDARTIQYAQERATKLTGQ